MKKTNKKQKAKIILVRYAQLFNTGNYENIRIEAEATVPEGEDASKVTAELQHWVHAQYDTLMMTAAIPKAGE